MSKIKDVHAEESQSEESESGDFLSIEDSNPQLMKDMNALITQLKKTLEVKEKTKLIKSKHPNPVSVYLNKYRQVMERTLPEEHEEYFMEVYRKYRIPILANKNDKWLRKNNVQVSYGGSKIRIMLSTVYNIACQLANDAEKKLEGFPDAAYDECIDLIRKDIILLHLYRIFKEFAPEKDKKQLSNVIVKIEEVLGLESEEEVVVSKDSKASNVANPLGDLGKLASSIVSGLNTTASENNISPEDMPDLGKVLGSVFENDALQGIMKNLVNAVSSGTESGEKPSFENAFGQVIKSLSSPEFKEAIVQTAATSTSSALKEHSGPRGLDTDIFSHSPHSPSEFATVTKGPTIEDVGLTGEQS